jgi:hypothetical protein
MATSSDLPLRRVRTPVGRVLANFRYYVLFLTFLFIGFLQIIGNGSEPLDWAPRRPYGPPDAFSPYDPNMPPPPALPRNTFFHPDDAAVSSAIQFLRLPVWSHGYRNCTIHPEVSCAEVVRAAATIRAWESNLSSEKTVGRVSVDINQEPIADRLSMLYHGLQAAVFTNRALIVDRSQFPNVSLPAAVRHAKSTTDGVLIDADRRFVCADLSARNPKLVIRGATWPQAFYVHSGLAPWLREHFAFHAAYFFGNYLFGTVEKPECALGEVLAAVEVAWFREYAQALKPAEFSSVIGRCGVAAGEIAFVGKSSGDRIVGYRKVELFHAEEEVVCALYKLMSATRVIHTFGSRLGFWATAMQGVAGGIVNPVDRICVNLTTSQQGSAWHTYCPTALQNTVFRTTKLLFPCGPSAEYFKWYFDYLVW